jgi:hypothetical protein
MSPVAILSPGYPDVSGGVTDHTARLVRHWGAAGHRAYVLGEQHAGPGMIAQRWRAVGVRGLLIQYVPFLYGRRGLSTYPDQLARAARSLGLRVVVFVHEPWVPPTRLPWLVLSPLQRRQLRRLLRHADAVVTAVPRWRDLLDKDAAVLYVGNTLGDGALPLGEPLATPVVFSPFAAGLRWPWIAGAVSRIGRGLTVIGATRPDAARHAGVRPWLRDEWTCLGRLPAAGVLSALANAPLVLAPFVDGITGRRTSALAGLSTGARTITSDGPLFDPVFRASPVTIATSAETFASAAAKAWKDPDSPEDRKRRVAWYREHFDGRALDSRLLEMLL